MRSIRVVSPHEETLYWASRKEAGVLVAAGLASTHPIKKNTIRLRPRERLLPAGWTRGRSTVRRTMIDTKNGKVPIWEHIAGPQ